jgi:hypothetical protein
MRTSARAFECVDRDMWGIAAREASISAAIKYKSLIYIINNANIKHLLCGAQGTGSTRLGFNKGLIQQMLILGRQRSFAPLYRARPNRAILFEPRPDGAVASGAALRSTKVRHYRRASIHASICVSSVSSGTEPVSSTASLKSRKSNFGPRRAVALARSSVILSWPILYANA